MSRPNRQQPDRERSVSKAFVELADTLVDDYDTIDVLDRLVAHSVTLLAADAAGILLADRNNVLSPVAASSEDARTMELLQLQAAEGPCVEAFRTATQVRVPDLSTMAPRWPRFVAALAHTGAFASVHAIPLRLRSEAIGAMNLFHRTPGPLPDADLALAQALADIATIAILQERAIRHGEIVTEQLQTALDSRVIIEQAKGMLAQFHSVSMDVAFDRLRRYARNHNQRLAEVARLCAEGQFDLHLLADPLPSSASPPPPRSAQRQNQQRS